ncbi:MAG: glycosyltransferase family 4 protein [Desulfobacula sp.]|nr:glycosyltransferase family 4 protein [Desulfobacula sp.]
MNKKIIYFITEDWYFWSHRLPIAKAAKDMGNEVIIVTRVNKHLQRIKGEGFRVIPIQLERQGKNVLKELRSLFEIIRIYSREKPDIVHQVAVKPVIYGSIAAIMTRIPVVINALAGLGFIFVNKGPKAGFIKHVFILLYKIVYRSKSITGLFQNPEDRDFFVSAGLIDKNRTKLIMGSGVDTSLFDISAEQKGVIRILFAGRMLWNKGVGELVAAGKILYSKGIKTQIILVGKPDKENPRAISKNILQSWHDKGVVEWWGYQENMVKIISACHIIALPTTYGEGVPKILIEAAASGRPVVATDVPGCREIVKDGQNGFLVQPHDIESLAEALEKLVKDSDLRSRMGRRGREIVKSDFSEEIVVEKTLKLYSKLLTD